ncbi:hypothetical protein [Demequina activiva]|uniref:hypothetical protein n=1 Tax=Demequina activiva TaxID=1582364 RepID=UPI001943216E|nr:hypothetical protein [Demequina activiva]
MSDKSQFPVPEVVPHLFYRAFSFDTRASAVTTESAEPARRLVARARRLHTPPTKDLAFSVEARELSVWPYFRDATGVFSSGARDVLEMFLGAEDNIVFESYPVALEGSDDVVHVAYCSAAVDIEWGLNAPLSDGNVGRYSGVDLRKLAGRVFFFYPPAVGDVALRGDVIIALRQLGWPGYAEKLPVMRGTRRVKYEEWAEHPEWTDYQPPR